MHASANSNHILIKGGGEMGRLISAFDWSQTAAGSIDQWSSSLRTLVNMMLSSRFPMLLFWGTDLVTFYNDAFRPSLGNDGKHPSSLGQKGEQSWAESWPVIGPMIHNIMAGGDAVWFEDQKLPLYREGKLGYAYWTYSFSAVTDDDGRTNGILVTCTETTKAVESRQLLEERQAQAFSFFEQSPVGIAILSAEELIFQMANPFYGELVGRKPDEIIGKPLLTALPELRGQGFDALLLEVVDTGIPFMAKELGVNIMRNGRLETIYVDLTYQPRREADQQINGILVVATDVTRQVLSRKSVEENEARFRALIEEAPVATCYFMGPEMVVEIINEKMIFAWGKDMTVKGKPLIEALPELRGQPFMDILAEVYTNGIIYEAKAARVDLVIDGKLDTYYYDFTYKPVFNTDGKVDGIINISINVTEEVIATQKLKEAEANMRGAVELAQLGTWSMDIEPNTITCSGRMAAWFGNESGKKEVPELISLIHAGDRQRIERAVQRAADPASDGVFDEVYTVIHPYTGQQRVLHAHGKTVLDQEGKPLRINGTAQDITVQRELQLMLEQEVQERTEELAIAIEELQATNEELATINEELEEANTQLIHSNNELAQYAYVASHDLQEPLRKIRIFSGILANLPRLPEESHPIIGKISASAERMTSLIQDLLEFSRLLKSDTLMRPIDLNEVMNAVKGDFELVIQEKSAEIIIGELPVIEGVSLQMNQLFFNLLSNALKFTIMDKQPVIRVDSSILLPEEVNKLIFKPFPFARYHLIRFTDNGIGFDSQYAEQIFEVFKRLHGREIYPGSGIGLSLCRRIVANHNGVLYAVSETGNGSTFNILLPDKQYKGEFRVPGMNPVSDIF